MTVNVGANHLTICHITVNVGANLFNHWSYDCKCRC